MELEDEKDSVSMVEVLEEEQKLEEDANAVLGGSDAVHCTYPKGYMARQALYSCLTCRGADGPPAGVCLACSLDCHEGHDLYELYTKRNFACDCGNSKFGDKKCKLCPEKSAINEKNMYNQNFSGLYCTCHRPYPDPDDHVEDAMIQCVICEDWYHGRHLKADIPDDNNYEEMICYQCMEKNTFLKLYRHLQVIEDTGQCQTHEDINKSINVDKITSEANSSSDLNDRPTAHSHPDNITPGSSSLHKESTQSSGISDNLNKTNHSNETVPSEETRTGPTSEEEVTRIDNNVSSDMTPSGGSQKCQLVQLQANTSLPLDVCSTFWKQGWRSSLCQCVKCMQMYERENISFITDLSDTITAYETKGRMAEGSSGSQYERGLEALSQMNRIQQVEVLHGFNDLKTELKDYLKKFAENGKVVKEEDIKEFFTGLASRKKQKFSMPYYCK